MTVAVTIWTGNELWKKARLTLKRPKKCGHSNENVTIGYWPNIQFDRDIRFDLGDAGTILLTTINIVHGDVFIFHMHIAHTIRI